MKKLITAALAATLAAGSAITAFAATELDIDTYNFGKTIKVDSKEYTMGTDLKTITIAGGEKIFFPIMADTNEDGTVDANITKASDLEDVRLSVKVNEGSKYVKASELVKKDGVYGAQLTIKDYFGSDSQEIEAKIELKNRKTGRTIASTEDITNLPTIELENSVTKVTSKKGVAEFKITKDTKIVSFDDNTDLISFSGDGFNFEVKASDQDDLYLGVSFDPVKEMAVAYQDADLDFISFPGEPEFDFTGDFSVFVPDTDHDYFLYEIKSNGLLTESSAKYNEKDEKFVLRTRKLSKYVLSDKELDVKKYNEGVKVDGKDEAKDETTTDKNETTTDKGDKENANTGAADMLGVASALAVVSLAVAGATTLKKNRK